MATNHHDNDKALYAPVSPMEAGIKGRCPRCGEGRLFNGVLAPAKGCMNCGLDYSFIDSGDGPAVFVILIIGFVVLGLAMALQSALAPPFWVHAIIWAPVITILSLLGLRISKGIMIALQYRTSAQEGKLEGALDKAD